MSLWEFLTNGCMKSEKITFPSSQVVVKLLKEARGWRIEQCSLGKLNSMCKDPAYCCEQGSMPSAGGIQG